jgi:hypothetical protein
VTNRYGPSDERPVWLACCGLSKQGGERPSPRERGRLVSGAGLSSSREGGPWRTTSTPPAACSGSGASGGLPTSPLPSYATHVVEGTVDLKTQSGTVTSRVLAGHPGGTSGIGLPGLSRIIRVTEVKGTETPIRLRGEIEDRSQLRRGRERPRRDRGRQGSRRRPRAVPRPADRPLARVGSYFRAARPRQPGGSAPTCSRIVSSRWNDAMTCSRASARAPVALRAASACRIARCCSAFSA